MNESTGSNSRRNFIAGGGAVAGALALASLSGSGNSVEAHEFELNAVNPTPEQFQKFMTMDHDGPIVMVNLLKFKPDGGAEHYAKYAQAVQPILKKIGARILFSGQCKTTLLGGAFWDAVALVEYANKMDLVKMAQSPEYQAIHHHREAGLEGQINLAVIQNDTLG